MEKMPSIWGGTIFKEIVAHTEIVAHSELVAHDRASLKQ